MAQILLNGWPYRAASFLQPAPNTATPPHVEVSPLFSWQGVFSAERLQEYEDVLFSESCEIALTLLAFLVMHPLYCRCKGPCHRGHG
jgi:hypothetical protein